MPEVRSLIATASTYSSFDSNLFLKDSRTASRMWGMNTPGLERLPRAKFLFMVNFLRPDTASAGLTRYGDWAEGISFLVKSVTRPGLTFKTDTLNQYNKKRVIQTGLEYEPITVSFYDTYDQRVMQMLKEYVTFYYGDFTAGSRKSWLYDVTAPEYLNTTDEFGFKVNNLSPDDEYFFDNIEFYQFGAGKYNKFSIIHPKLVSFDYDDEDYTDTNTPQMINMRFAYEGILFETENQPIPGELATMYGLDLGDFGEVFFPKGSTPPSPTDLRRQISPQPFNSAPVLPGRSIGSVALIPDANQVNPSYSPSIPNVGGQLGFDRANTARTNPSLGTIIAEEFNIRPTYPVANAGRSFVNRTLSDGYNRATSSLGKKLPAIVRNPLNNAVSRTINRFTGGLF